MPKKPLSDNANAFWGLTTFMVGKKIEIKVITDSNLVEQIQYCAKRF